MTDAPVVLVVRVQRDGAVQVPERRRLELVGLGKGKGGPDSPASPVIADNSDPWISIHGSDSPAWQAEPTFTGEGDDAEDTDDGDGEELGGQSTASTPQCATAACNGGNASPIIVCLHLSDDSLVMPSFPEFKRRVCLRVVPLLEQADEITVSVDQWPLTLLIIALAIGSLHGHTYYIEVPTHGLGNAPTQLQWQASTELSELRELPELQQRTVEQGMVKDIVDQLRLCAPIELPISQGHIEFITRLSDSIRRDRNSQHAPNPLSIYTKPAPDATVKAMPTVEQGVSVFEFFSGIGGMRLGLPETIRNCPIKEVVAFDVSVVANEIYRENFDNRRQQQRQQQHCANDRINGTLREILINGLKVADVDGAADVWTMSPPCQPFTTTRHAKRMDHCDNRSRGLFHIMNLLLAMKRKPRWIVFENVKGFVGSRVHEIWLGVLRDAGYRFRQYLLSPISSVGIPNHRLRYYCVAEHGDSPGSEWLDVGSRIADSCGAGAGADVGADSSSMRDKAARIHEQLPDAIAARFPTEPVPLALYISLDLSHERKQELYLSLEALSSPGIKHISVVGAHDRETYCFTKSYGGRILDQTSGSTFLEGMEKAIGSYNGIDRDNMLALHGRLRLFDPSELLAMAGFPPSFRFPVGMPLKNCFGAIGNSVNVTVVKAVMASLFQDHLT
jgi:tRNA (cytosine38-C5)-methyltransferase